MKQFVTLFICAILLFSEMYSQIFTKITVGPQVNNGGDSRAVNWIDYDNDGDVDLFVTNGPQGGENNFFYINNGDGTFTRDTLIAITNDHKASDGSSWSDYDNDGDLDLFVANWWNQNNLLYKNNGDKTFLLVKDTKIYTDIGCSETGSWGDYNNDGFVDLYVCNSYSPFLNFLYKNNGDGSFTKCNSGDMVTDKFTSRNVDWIDYDNDGDSDIFIVNEENQNENLYRNDGNDSFTKIMTGPLTNSGGCSVSSSWEDFDNDGDFDVFISNYQSQNNFYFANNGDGTFTRITTGTFVNDNGNSFGTATGDIDNDGDVDLYIANGFTESKQTNNFLYLNNGDGTFTKVINDVSVNDNGWSYGCAFGDYTKDGFLDLFVAKCFNGRENNSLFKNNGGNNNWLIIDLEGKTSNRSAIGAIVKVKAKINGIDRWQMRRVAGQNGYCGQNLQLHFGLGNASIVDSIQIKWPSGIIEKLGPYTVNQFMNIIENSIITEVNNINNASYKFFLSQNYPNPFNPITNIKYTLPQNSQVVLEVFNILGEKVVAFDNGIKPAGYHETVFNANDLASGIYIYRLSASSLKTGEKFVKSAKMMLIK